MTKKDYKLIALSIATVKASSEVHNHPMIKWVAEELADNLAQDNPRFDKNKFLAACGFTL